MSNVEEAEQAFLFALLMEYEVDPSTYVRLSALHEKYDLAFPESWLDSLVSEWEDFGWVDVSRTHDGTSALIKRTRYSAVLKHVLASLGATSLTIDARKEEILSDVSPRETTPIPNGWKWLTFETEKPNRDFKNTMESQEIKLKIVALDAKSKEFDQVRAGLDGLIEQVRGANDLEDRDRILASLTAAQTLWSSASLRLVQIKVGVLLAIDDAAAALGTLAKGVRAGLLVDLVKSIVKNKTGLDLDNI
ncbi:hypothetical protein [Sphingopyxis sp. MWB1]|uniref:hypothetical protein n=1 Tax=Sphingopyxis sp. MWB1 TaxID=1537715 RepID=UPI000A4190BE|nr:hypothetical protein [Sphingopyxis sp. MWB1]